MKDAQQKILLIRMSFFALCEIAWFTCLYTIFVEGVSVPLVILQIVFTYFSWTAWKRALEEM